MRNLASVLEPFLNEDGKLALFAPRQTIWVPQEVDLVWQAPPLPSFPEPENNPWLIYSESDHREWPTKPDTTGVLNAFLGLADLSLTEQKGAAQVQAFAKAWGPLWLCQTRGHYGYGSADCSWFIKSIAHASPCTWQRQESGATFVRKAQEAKAVLEIVHALRHNREVSLAGWQTTGLDRRHPGLTKEVAQWPRAKQCATVVLIVNWHLLSYGSPLLLLTWEESISPRLVLDRADGVLAAVWLQIAQLLCGAKGFFTCDECGRFYIPTRNYTPRVNQRHFCDDCGLQAAKRQSKARQRAQQRATPTERGLQQNQLKHHPEDEPNGT